MSECLLDLIYNNDPSTPDFVRAIIRKICEQDKIDYRKNPQQEWQVPEENWRQWDYIESIVSTGVSEGEPYVAVASVQYMLNIEQALLKTIRQQLEEPRSTFFEQIWLPLLENETYNFKNRFDGSNGSEVMKSYVNRMMESWLTQRGIESEKT